MFCSHVNMLLIPQFLFVSFFVIFNVVPLLYIALFTLSNAHYTLSVHRHAFHSLCFLFFFDVVL